MRGTLRFEPLHHYLVIGESEDRKLTIEVVTNADLATFDSLLEEYAKAVKSSQPVQVCDVIRNKGYYCRIVQG